MDINKCKRILEITTSTYTEEIVKKQYRKLSKRYHPDSHDKPDAAMFRLITEAKDLLLEHFSYESLNSDGFSFNLINIEYDKENKEITFKVVTSYPVNGTIQISVTEPGYTYVYEYELYFHIKSNTTTNLNLNTNNLKPFKKDRQIVITFFGDAFAEKRYNIKAIVKKKKKGFWSFF